MVSITHYVRFVKYFVRFLPFFLDFMRLVQIFISKLLHNETKIYYVTPGHLCRALQHLFLLVDLIGTDTDVTHSDRSFRCHLFVEEYLL